MTRSMMASDVPEVAALIIQAAAILKQLENAACSLPSESRKAEVNEFRAKVQTLRQKQEFWKSQSRKSAGFKVAFAESGYDVGPIALAALKVLEEEEPTIRKINQPFVIRACLDGKFSRWNFEFPIRLTEALQTVIDAFDSMPKALNGSQRTSTLPLDVPMKIRHSRLPFGIEKRYIPLRRSATRIRRALENPAGPQVVVLHGGPGTGTSSLARYLALRYQDGDSQGFVRGEERLGSIMRGSSVREQGSDPYQSSRATLAKQTSVRSETTLLHGSRFPGGVFYVSCIHGTNIVDKQLQLLQDLGFTPPIGKLSHLSLDEILSRLQNKVMEYLGKRDALVVIDNVWDPTIVKWLLVPGSKVKYLVTTHDATLLQEEGFDSVSIPIEKLSLETARRILASPTPSDDPELQEVLDAIVGLTMANPAALIQASMTILRTSDLEEWKDVRNNLEALNLLSLQGDGFMAFPREIPRNIGCTMMLALESLPQGVEKLLVALAVLEGPFVPQVVVQLLVKSSDGNLASFSRSRNFLEDRALIRLHHQTVWWSSSVLQTTTWHIDSLLQRFIQVRKAKAVASMVDSLFSSCCTDSNGFVESDDTLTVALCAVYGAPSVADRAAMNLGAFVHPHDLARIWAAPLVSLFQATESRTKEEKRKQEIHCQARQVFLAYVCNENPDKGIRGLLASPAAIGPTCWSIAWAVPNQKRALFARSARTLRGLVNLIDKDVSSDLHECATAALWNLSMVAETKTVVARAPGLLDEVVRLLTCGVNENVKRHAAGMVASLASERENQEQLAMFPGLVQNLVGLLRDHTSCNVQVYAAHAFMHLASAGPNKEPIAAFPGALEGLVELMHGAMCVHEIAVGAIMNLAVAPDNKPIIAKFPGALDSLVRLMAESPSSLAQKRAAATLVSLSSTRKFLAIRLFPGVLEKLVELLSKFGHPELQEVAAKILGNLAVVEENAGTIANFPGAWRGLLRLLNKDMILDVQMQALDTIGLLAVAPHTSKVGITGVATALQELLGLVSCNYQHNLDILEKVLVSVFRILDTGDGTNFVAISKFPESLDQLVHLLGLSEFPDLQEMSAAILASLAKWKQNRMAIADCPGALEGLVDLLAEGDVKPSVQAVALKTLWHVAYREDRNRKIIVDFPDFLHRIGALLEKDSKPASVQVCAALVLSTLAGVEGTYVNSDSIPGLLDKLSALLADDVCPSVQQEAAKARTLLDWESSNSLSFTSIDAHAGRGRANAQLGMLQQALSDFDVALRSMWDKDFTLQRDRLDEESQGNGSRTPMEEQDFEIDILHGKIAHVLSNQAYVKAVLHDYQGALRDANNALELQPRDNLLWQERGVLKRLMDDLPGALEDLEASLQIAPNDYETLKHCGFVCFLRDDLKAAYTIAEHALEIDLDRGYDPPDGDEYCRLGKLPVSYLDFVLR